ncbi:MAG: cell division protein FtsZ [Alphaproteobacteria bacterium RIFCSPHIGHO2_12_FULL_63_12]|nr:MAG: cell division protein FtsZ [Alphaproteobacteria bacterium RIFCSPHIGHO2_12_FULL_63_12]
MPLNLSVPELTELKPRISVIGVGGAGGNAVNNMVDSGLEGVDFVVANTDAQALGLSKATRRIQLGAHTTQGLGAGSLPEIGRAAAEETLDEILEQVGNSHMLFITAGMGGGTGTGAAPVIAKAAKERDILTVGVVTKPFHFEGARRMKIALAGIEALQAHVDTLLIIPNQNLFSIANERTTFAEAFALADQVLHSGVRGITDLMVMPGLINLDFNDVRTVMREMGKAMMGTGEASGDKRAIEAAEAAISNPLLDEVSMKGAKGVLINITGSMDMKLFEVDEAANRIRAEVDPDANIIVGSTFNQELEGRVRVSVVATGIEAMPRDVHGYQQRATTVAVSKPWRESAQAPEAVPAAEAAPAPVAARVAMPPVQHALPTLSQSPAPAPAPRPAAHPLAAQATNPVGDVHERIRRMLTEGTVDASTAPRMPAAAPIPAPQPVAQAPRHVAKNPFREAAEEIQRASIGALDLLKSLTPKAEEPAAVRVEEQPVRPARASHGDLFDDEDDGELEIPSFLRKKKVS